MGGDNESTVEQKAPAKKGMAGEQAIGTVRIHESNREIHFHDDTNGLKAAVPVATWYTGWERLSCGLVKKFTYVDVVNKTQLTVRLKVMKMVTVKAAQKAGSALKNLKPKRQVCTLIEVSPVEFDAEFVALQKLTKGS